MSIVFNKDTTILFLFKEGRKERLNDDKSCPSEFFYCYKELLKDGYSVNYLEQKDLNLRINNVILIKILNFISKLFFNLPIQNIFAFIWNKSYLKLKDANYIIPTTNSLGVVLSAASTLGLIKANILFINMGLFVKKPNFFRILIYKFILKNIKLITISRFEYKFLSKYLRSIDIDYMPFGVDHNFWYPQKKLLTKPYILAIGNDLSRDWEFLESSWDESYPLLKIVTSLPIKTSKKNVNIIRGNWHFQTLTDLEIRNLYRDSEFVIITLKETLQPSGQSVALQAMACSKAVLITDIKGIWDKDLLKHKENIFLLKQGDKEELQNAILLFLKDNQLRQKIEVNGRKLVERYFNVETMKDNLIKILGVNN